MSEAKKATAFGFFRAISGRSGVQQSGADDEVTEPTTRGTATGWPHRAGRGGELVPSSNRGDHAPRGTSAEKKFIPKLRHLLATLLLGAGLALAPLAIPTAAAANPATHTAKKPGATRTTTPTTSAAPTTTSTTTATLTAAKSGDGAGTVTSNVGGINCGNTCSATFNPPGSTVTLIAAAAPGSIFAGWSGPCTGTSSCLFQISSNTTVTAKFTKSATPTYTLSTAMEFEYGYGGATITSNPSGIDCYSDCSETYAAGTTVTLSVQPWSDTEFLGWTGACTGPGTSCTVSMAANQNAIASFRFVGYIP